MIKGTTKSGFKFEIQDDTLNDYELFEMISVVDVNPLILPRLVARLLGEEQKNNLINHVRGENDIAPLDKVSDEVKEIFETKPVKNS
ncbi:MAG: hypothetical protein EOM12_08605 [Verrucomicrobiae bacterium]|nr:hypothetical protein [Verrucomicrobiae bacterium]